MTPQNATFNAFNGNENDRVKYPEEGLSRDVVVQS